MLQESRPNHVQSHSGKVRLQGASASEHSVLITSFSFEVSSPNCSDFPHQPQVQEMTVCDKPRHRAHQEQGASIAVLSAVGPSYFRLRLDLTQPWASFLLAAAPGSECSLLWPRFCPPRPQDGMDKHAVFLSTGQNRAKWEGVQWPWDWRCPWWQHQEGHSSITQASGGGTPLVQPARSCPRRKWERPEAITNH